MYLVGGLCLCMGGSESPSPSEASSPPSTPIMHRNMNGSTVNTGSTVDDAGDTSGVESGYSTNEDSYSYSNDASQRR